MSDSLPPCSPPGEYVSYVFLLDEAGQVHPLPHELYVALARREGSSPGFAGRTFRLADWYVRLKNGVPDQVVNEWYGWVGFDAQGRFLPAPERDETLSPASRQGTVDNSALPTAAERERMQALLFGPPPPPQTMQGGPSGPS